MEGKVSEFLNFGKCPFFFDFLFDSYRIEYFHFPWPLNFENIGVLVSGFANTVSLMLYVS